MLTGKDSLHDQATIEIIAGNHELHRFTRGQETSVPYSPDTAECRKVATTGKTLADRPIKHARGEVRQESQHNYGEFLDAWFVRRYETREP